MSQHGPTSDDTSDHDTEDHGEEVAADDISRSGGANQVREEPIPASHEDDSRQEAVVRNEQASGSGAGQPDESDDPIG